MCGNGLWQGPWRTVIRDYPYCGRVKIQVVASSWGVPPYRRCNWISAVRRGGGVHNSRLGVFIIRVNATKSFLWAVLFYVSDRQLITCFIDMYLINIFSTQLNNLTLMLGLLNLCSDTICSDIVSNSLYFPISCSSEVNLKPVHTSYCGCAVIVFRNQ